MKKILSILFLITPLLLFGQRKKVTTVDALRVKTEIRLGSKTITDWSDFYQQNSAPGGTLHENDLWLDTDDGKFYVYDGSAWVEIPIGSGVTDGDKSDITVSVGGTIWTIDAGVITPAMLDRTYLESEVDGSITNELDTIYDPAGTAKVNSDTIQTPTDFWYTATNDLSGFFPPLAVYINADGELQPSNRATLRPAKFILAAKSGNNARLVSHGAIEYSSGPDGKYWTGDGGGKLTTEPSDTIQFLYEKFGDTLWVNVEPDFRLGTGGGGPTVTGSQYQLAIIDVDGNLIGTVNLTYNLSNNRISIGPGAGSSGQVNIGGDRIITFGGGTGLLLNTNFIRTGNSGSDQMSIYAERFRFNGVDLGGFINASPASGVFPFAGRLNPAAVTDIVLRTTNDSGIEGASLAWSGMLKRSPSTSVFDYFLRHEMTSGTTLNSDGVGLFLGLENASGTMKKTFGYRSFLVQGAPNNSYRTIFYNHRDNVLDTVAVITEDNNWFFTSDSSEVDNDYRVTVRPSDDGNKTLKLHLANGIAKGVHMVSDAGDDYLNTNTSTNELELGSANVTTSVKGTAVFKSVDNANVDTDKFAVFDGDEMKHRSGSQLLSDLGIQDTIPFILYPVQRGTAITQTVGFDFDGDALFISKEMAGCNCKAEYAILNSTATTGTLTLGIRRVLATNALSLSNLSAVTFNGASGDVRKESANSFTVSAGEYYFPEVSSIAGTLDGTNEGLMVTIKCWKP